MPGFETIRAGSLRLSPNFGNVWKLETFLGGFFLLDRNSAWLKVSSATLGVT